MNLPSGKYTFEVLAANSDGIWSKNPATFSFYIKPYFYKTLWFKTLIAIIAIYLIYLTVHYQVSRIRKEKEVLKLQLLESEKKLEVRKLEDMESKRYLSKLTESMEKDKLYKDSNLNLAMLSDHLGVTFSYLSKIINKNLNKNINTFINEYRVSEVMKK